MPFGEDDGPSICNIIQKTIIPTSGALIGLGLSYLSLQSFRNFAATTSALSLIQNTQETPISDLRTILENDETSSSISGQKFVIVRGIVRGKPVDGLGSGRNGYIVAPKSGEMALVVERSQEGITIFNGKVKDWTKDVLDFVSGTNFKAMFQRGTILTRRSVPFILVERERWPSLNYLVINLDGSNHTLPLTTVYRKLLPVHISRWRIFLAFQEANICDILDKEKILRPGKEICAIGLCSLKGGVPYIKSSQRLPYFLSDKTKDEMVTEMSYAAELLYGTGLVFGLLSFGILYYAVPRNWRRWKEWRARRRGSAAPNQSNADS